METDQVKEPSTEKESRQHNDRVPHLSTTDLEGPSWRMRASSAVASSPAGIHALKGVDTDLLCENVDNSGNIYWQMTYLVGLWTGGGESTLTGESIGDIGAGAGTGMAWGLGGSWVLGRAGFGISAVLA